MDGAMQMRNGTDFVAAGGRLVALAVLGVIGVGAMFLLAGFTLFAMIFLVGLAALGAVGFAVAAIARLFGRDGRRDPQIVEAEYRRSEEHTSELQSLMRISYAVFCLKKKNI